MPEVLYIGTAQQDSPWLHVARVIKKLILYFISFYPCWHLHSHMCLVPTIISTAAEVQIVYYCAKILLSVFKLWKPRT